MGHTKVNLTEYQYFLIVKYKEHHFPLKSHAFLKNPPNNYKYNFFMAQIFSRESNIK